MEAENVHNISVLTFFFCSIYICDILSYFAELLKTTLSTIFVIYITSENEYYSWF